VRDHGSLYVLSYWWPTQMEVQLLTMCWWKLIARTARPPFLIRHRYFLTTVLFIEILSFQ
jgi:hypothetical protein